MSIFRLIDGHGKKPTVREFSNSVTTIELGNPIGKEGSTRYKSNAKQLVSKAQSENKSGNIEQAIILLRDAYKLAEDEKEELLTIGMYLHLPLYLQKVGKGDEGWKELNQLLVKQTEHKIPFNLSHGDILRVYDKMRLYLQREKKYKEAIIPGLVHFLMEAQEKYFEIEERKRGNIFYKEKYRKWNEELRENGSETILDDGEDIFLEYIEYQTEMLNHYISIEYITEHFGKLLKKAKLENITPNVAEMICSNLSDFPKIDIAGTKQAISTFL